MYKSVPIAAIACTALFTPLLDPLGRTDQVLDVVDHLATPLAEVPFPRAVKYPQKYTSLPTAAIAKTVSLTPLLDPLGRTDQVLVVVDHLATLLAEVPFPRAVNPPPMYKSVPIAAIEKTLQLTPLLDPLGRRNQVLVVVDHLATLLAEVPFPRAVNTPPMYKSVPITAIANTPLLTPSLDPLGRRNQVLVVVDHLAIKLTCLL
jgi:hypothetical protein